MRIAYICADSGIPVFGCKGASVHIQEVLRALLRSGAEIVLFAHRLAAPPEGLQQIKLVPLDPLPGGSTAEREQAALAANVRLAQRLQAEGPFDLVYERYSLWSFAGLACARRQGWRTLLEVNAPLIDEQRRYRELVARDKAEEVLRKLLASAAAVIAVSPGMKAWLAAFAGSDKDIHVVANGVDPQRFAPRRQREITPGAPVIGFVGTLKPWHGVENLLEAFALLQPQRPDVWLLIVGDGPQRQALQKSVQQRPVANVVFTGAVEPARVPQWLGRMDIAVAPYPALANFYFSPLKIYEYMAAQLPVVASRVGHLGEIIKDGVTGLLAEPDDPAALCASLRLLVDEPLLRQRLGEAARAYVKAEGSWDSVAATILQIAAQTEGSI